MVLNTVLLMSGGWVQALQLLAALSLLIVLHEFGHFFFARLFGTRVEKFYLFFDFLFPFSGLLNFSLFKKKKGDTTYGIGWFPLGGYVKIAGMVDESMDKDALAKPPEPWEYRSKKAYQRLFIMLGGIIMNLLVAMVVYALIFGVWGESYLLTENAKNGITTSKAAQSIGLKDGDMIVSLDGKKVDRFNKIVSEIIFTEAKSIEVLRDGQLVTVSIPEGTVNKIIKAQKDRFIAVRTPLVVDQVDAKTAAEKMGLKPNDSLIAVNGAPVHFYDEFDSIKRASAAKPISMTVVRGGSEIVELTGTVPENMILGFRPKSAEAFYPHEQVNYGFAAAIGKGVTHTFHQFGFYWDQLKFMFTSKEVKASESVGGIVSFGKLFPPEFSWFTFLQLTAFISIILAFMNLLPIPGLDGGYVIFLLWELITRRKVNEKVMEYATTAGLVLLLGLMLYANGLDIVRLFK